MTKLERLEDLAISQGVEIVYLQLPGVDGLCLGKTIFLSPNLTYRRRLVVLAEELAHFQYTVGDITAQDTTDKRKAELQARRQSYETIVPFEDIIELLKSGEYLSEIADLYELPEEYISEALAWYQTKHPEILQQPKAV